MRKNVVGIQKVAQKNVEIDAKVARKNVVGLYIEKSPDAVHYFDSIGEFFYARMKSRAEKCGEYRESRA